MAGVMAHGDARFVDQMPVPADMDFLETDGQFIVETLEPNYRDQGAVGNMHEIARSMDVMFAAAVALVAAVAIQSVTLYLSHGALEKPVTQAPRPPST